MMKIQSILNPLSVDSRGDRENSIRSSGHTRDHSYTPAAPAPKRQKVEKDATVFTPGDIRCEVRYPPHEAGQDTELLSHHSKFQMRPMGHINKYPKRIPYSSDKKTFLEKTGRDCFEVFQYNFKMPGDDKEYEVMWDYSNGLVRITPFFKCCKYSKTTPAKALNLNPGLRSISHSITGGSIKAQGYWMPYEAAKAITATFCYDIRWVLTPLFGKDFLDLCIPRGGQGFESFKIDPKIVRQCTQESEQRRQSAERRTTPARYTSTPRITPKSTPSSSPWATKALRPRRSGRELDTESGYATDTDQSDRYFYSHDSSLVSRRGWTTINEPRSAPRTDFVTSYSKPLHWPTLLPDAYDKAYPRSKRARPDDDCVDETCSTCSEDSSELGLSQPLLGVNATSKEIKAAYALMQLSNADASLASKQ